MDKENKYERMYENLLEYEHKIHNRNQKRIRIGLKCIWIIPLIFLALLFWTGSSKIIFLVLWIVSLFAIAIYLILVEYMDYKLQEKLHELDDDVELSSLVVGDFENVENILKAAIQRIDLNLNAEEELRIEPEEATEQEEGFEDESVGEAVTEVESNCKEGLENESVVEEASLVDVRNEEEIARNEDSREEKSKDEGKTEDIKDEADLKINTKIKKKFNGIIINKEKIADAVITQEDEVAENEEHI